MPRTSSLEINRQRIEEDLKAYPERVFTVPELKRVFELHKTTWGVKPSTTPSRFLAFGLAHGFINKIELRPEENSYRRFTRYAVEGASDFAIALSLRPRSYLTHATAIHLHGLSDQLPKVIYANQEQRGNAGGGDLSQAGIDRAFANRQRMSKYVYWHGEKRIVLLAGKDTGDAGVETMEEANRQRLRVTGIERTLIDIVVRPAYAGGIFHVLDAFRGALGKVSVPRLVNLLNEIDYTYPYHQAIGFLMERAGFPESETRKLRKKEAEFDFYLAHGLKEKDYDKSWRLFYPRGF